MVQERIDILVNERGSRTVRRRLTAISDTAVNATRSLRLMQNALFVLGGAGILRAIQRQVDNLTAFENRLRLVTDTVAEHNKIQEELFDISNRTRTSFNATADVFARVALSVRGLGVSQRETLQFTESLNKAVILSGPAAREANAAMVQLGQGLASNRLSGDELRSVLEQLPFVSDVIAKSLGVTRGELRALGREGKITADVVLKAFRESREEIAERFARTVPTIGQAFTVFGNSLLRIIDKIDDMTGASGGLARAIIGVAMSLEALISVLLGAGAAFAALKITTFIQGLFAAIQANRQLTAAVAAGNATLLTAEGIEQAKAASSLRAAQAQATETAAKVRDITVGRAQLQQNLALLQQQQASIIIDSRRRIARDALTGRFIAYNAAVAHNIRTNRALLLTERALSASKAQLTAATTAQTAATNALAAAQTRSAAAAAANNTFLARLGRTFPLLAASLGSVVNGLRFIVALVAANPLGVFVTAVVGAVTALTFFSDRIEVTADGIVTLRDVAVATFQLIAEAVKPVTDFIGDQFSAVINTISSAWNVLAGIVGNVLTSILQTARLTVNGIIALFTASLRGIIRAWDILPAAFRQIGTLAINALIEAVEAGINAIIEAIRSLFGFIDSLAEAAGIGKIFDGVLGEFRVNLGRFKGEVGTAATDVGSIFAEEFKNAFEQDFVGQGINAVLERARQIAEQRLADLSKTGERRDTPPGSSGRGVTFEDIVKRLEQENALLRVNATEREKLAEIFRIERALKRELTEGELATVQNLLETNQALRDQSGALDKLREPQESYTRRVAALNSLLEQGKIKQDEFNRSLRQARIDFLDTQRDIASGFERGFLKAIEEASNFAEKSEAIVKRAFDGMADALAEFVTTGKLDFRSLIQDINKQIIKLVISQAFQQLFGGFTGFGGGAGAAGGGGGFFGSFFGKLFGAQTGADFTVGPTTGLAPLTGTDNRLVAFRAQDGERVQVTPRGESPQQPNQNISITFNIQTPDVEGFRRSEGQLAARAARMISRGQRNM